MEIIETKRIQSRFARALSSYDSQADAQHRISRKLTELLLRYAGNRYNRVLEIGCGTGSLTRNLQEHCLIDEWILNDLCPQFLDHTRLLFPSPSPLCIAGDAEQAAFPGRFDLIASASAFQWMKHPEAFLQKLGSLLVPHGFLLVSTFAPGNLHEISHLTGKGLHYPTPKALIGWLPPGFQLLHCQKETIPLTFGSPLHVLRHLQATGVTATGNGCWTRGMQEEFCRRYTESFPAANNQVTLTYRPLYLLAVKK